MSSVLDNIFKSDLLNSIADFVHNVSNLKTIDISVSMQGKITHMAYTIIPEHINLIEEMLDQMELCYADRAGKLRLDQEKLTVFQQKLERLLVSISPN